MKKSIMVVFMFMAVNCQAGEILDLDKGLTLARIESQGKIHTIAVTADDGERIQGVNISKLTGIEADIPLIYSKLGYEKIKRLVQANNRSNISTYSYPELLSPAGNGEHHIGLGFNYASHAEEVNAERSPFLFLKTTSATRRPTIATGEGCLLDYEIEVCARPLAAISEKSTNGISFGFFICGDFTDRAVLLRNINLDNMQSGKGFNVAKSREGYLLTGPYLVVPRDHKEFLTGVTTSLYRNGALKQHGTPKDMIWPLDTIVEKIFHARRLHVPTFTDSSERWIPGETITPDMVLLTGTPEGVIMRPPPLGFKILQGIQYVFSGAFLNTTPGTYTIEKYISHLIEENIFLQPGESISMHGTYMGRIELMISKE